MRAKITGAFLITGVILLVLFGFLRKGEKFAKVSLPNLPNHTLLAPIINSVRLYTYNKLTP